MKKILFLAALALSSVLMADDIVGGILGGAIGGVIGNQFGSGDGKTAATIGGAVIGTMLGSGGNSRSYNDGGYTNSGYSNGGYANQGYTNSVTTQRYVTYARPQQVVYYPQQTVYVQQSPRIVYVRGHRHDDDYRGGYNRYATGDGYREMRRYRDDD